MPRRSESCDGPRRGCSSAARSATAERWAWRCCGGSARRNRSGSFGSERAGTGATPGAACPDAAGRWPKWPSRSAVLRRRCGWTFARCVNSSGSIRGSSSSSRRARRRGRVPCRRRRGRRSPCSTRSGPPRRRKKTPTTRRAPTSGGSGFPRCLGMPVEENAPAMTAWPWLTYGLAAALVAVFALTVRNLEGRDRRVRIGARPTLAARRRHLHHQLFSPCRIAAPDRQRVFSAGLRRQRGRRSGRWRFVLLLAAADLFGNLLHVAGNPHSMVPCVGASGGISGVIAYYALRFPRARLGIMFSYWLYFGAGSTFRHTSACCSGLGCSFCWRSSRSSALATWRPSRIWAARPWGWPPGSFGGPVASKRHNRYNTVEQWGRLSCLPRAGENVCPARFPRKGGKNVP